MKQDEWLYVRILKDKTFKILQNAFGKNFNFQGRIKIIHLAIILILKKCTNMSFGNNFNMKQLPIT